MASGGKRVETGSFYGTGADKEIRTVGFRPKHVKVINRTGLCEAEWSADMPDDSAHKRVTAGTQTFITANGITPLSDGFALGADADLNVDGELCYWVASD
jgi:hypothetical protein